MALAILYRKELKEYDFGPGHPFQGDRYEIFPQFLRKTLHGSAYEILQAEWARDEDLQKVCSAEYID